MPHRVIIDTDPGIDDALALLLALRSPELEIAAITTVSGNVPVEVATRNVFTVLSLFPAITAPPVAKGASRPLKKAAFYAEQIHGEDGLGGIYSIREASGEPRYAPQAATLSRRDAVHEILYQLSVTWQPVTVISLGPLTNIASAMEKDRAAMAKISRVVLMGGAVGVPGNVTPVAEYNLYCDPHAANIVFRSGIPLTMVGLDVTRPGQTHQRGVEERAFFVPNGSRPVHS
jgi:inosine-uridine nucleoside N-ribohydrolase